MSTVQSPEQVQAGWLGRPNRLIDDVKKWAEELDWSTRRIEIRLQESRIGAYQAPALLLQQEAVRVLLQPIASSAPGTEGVVDLYAMPAYDDIASIYHYDGSWHVHYMFSGTPTVGDIHDAPAKPLTKETLAEVLGEMKRNV